MVQANPPYWLWQGMLPCGYNWEERTNMPTVRMIENVPCASPKCTGFGIKWCPDDRFIPFAEGERAGAWFCRECAWKPRSGLDAEAFIVPANFAWDAWADIEAMENAAEGEP